MPTQRIPLFQGLVQPVHVGIGAPAVTDIFTPPDATSKAPQTYEVHLWLVPNTYLGGLGNSPLDISVFATEGPVASATKAGPLFRGYPFSGAYSWAPVKVLDGVPIRGNVQLSLAASTPAGTDRYPNGTQLWGYYHLAGQGQKVELERRSISRPDLAGFGAGVPFAFNIPAGGDSIAKSAKQIIHTFEPGRFDDIVISLDSGVGAVPAAAFPGWELFFEDVNGVPVIDPAHALGFWGDPTTTVPLFAPANLNSRLQTELSPYVFKGTFGGHPRLHHIAARLTRTEANESVSGFLHGHFVRH